MVKALLGLCIMALIGCKTDGENAQPTDSNGAKTDSLRAVCLE
jgi:hypothetical protein